MRKEFFLFIFIAFILLPVCAIAQLSLPSTAMGKPTTFLNEQESWSWDNVVRQRQWGKESSQPWIVYVDREGVIAYQQPKIGSSVERTLHFMDPYYVAKIENGFALLFSEKTQEGLTISKRAKSIGWVSVDELLLWTSCPRTIGQVYQKAVILKDIDAIQNKKDINETSPEFSKSPSQMIGAGWRATDLEFYFVYKTSSNGAALLFEDSQLKYMDVVAKEKKGWMRRGLYTQWNERLCYEPNYGPDVAGGYAAIFKNKAGALSFKQTEDYESNDPLWVEKLKKKRWAPNQVRFPVLEMNSNYIAQVGTIGSMGDGNNPGNSQVADEINNLNRKIDAIERKMDRVNVVFVMDGTSSMRNYYQPMAKALQNAMNQNSMRGANMYFGAVVYRNYADGDRVTEMKQLTQDYQSVANWLVSRECKSIGESHYEAMYYGLDYALSNMNWSKDNCNFMILVGDAANDANDKKGKTMNGVVSKMTNLGINFVAFQANHMNHAAYHDFAVQIQKLMINELSQLMGRQVKRNDFLLTNQLYQVKSKENEWPIYSSAYRFAQIDKSENANELESIVEKKIVDFKNQANQQLVELRIAVENAGGESSDKTTTTFDSKRVESILSQIGLTKREIELLREANTTLKVKGYATRSANNVNVFAPCVFMSKAELDDLISSLTKVSQNVSTNRRQDLQNALKSLALSYIGQGKDANEISVDDVMDAVSGLTAGTGRSVLSSVNLKDITNPNKVTDKQISDFIEQIKVDVSVLNERLKDKECYFVSKNHVRYYYILLEDMPLQYHEDN